MDNSIDLKWITEQIRNQRHDFMNYLQVIYGYLQINRPNDAVDYIKKVNKKMIMLSQIYNIDSPIISMFVHDIINQLEKNNIEWELKNIESYISKEDLSKNIYIYKELYIKYISFIYNFIKDNMENEEVDIYLVYYKERPSFILMNNTLTIKELNFLEFKTYEERIHITSSSLAKVLIVQF
ncbi:MAG: Spo0B domain-containing protein [Clostridiales bacterium]|nr:Spo0B domain-containing protein [Clostridiales bacterium]